MALNTIFTLPNSRKKSLPSLEQSTTKRSGHLKRTKSKMARLMTHKYLAEELTFITERQRVN